MACGVKYLFDGPLAAKALGDTALERAK